MNTAVFDYHEFQRLIEQFSAIVPTLLARHHTTVDLVPRVVDLFRAVETPFTVAIVGQMRVGKSSLLNALVGADLAVTGVTETTATINWFKYGEGDQCRRFRAVWRDRPAEDFPLAEITHWVGDSKRAEATRYIEFFSHATFLRLANVVDTPGTRSTIESHENVTRDFLALRRERETQREGTAADAILYVVPCVVRQSDQDLLNQFESGTRLPGSYPYNSLAVMHKWETVETADPLAHALHKAEKMSAKMADIVAAVVPVSAPLAMAAERFPNEFWLTILKLTANTSPDILDELLAQPKDFREIDRPKFCSLDRAERQRLMTQFPVPWKSFQLIIKLALANQPSNIEALRDIVKSASGIDLLRDELDRRFFSRSRMIKAFSVLAKAWEPCQIAAARLRNYSSRLSSLLDGAERSRDCLSVQIGKGVSDLVAVRDYVDATRRLAEDDTRTSAEVLRELGNVQTQVRDAYEDMNLDIQNLELLDRCQDVLDSSLVHRLRCLFGFRGPEIQARWGPWRSNIDESFTIDDVEDAIGEIRKRHAAAHGDVRRLLDHAQLRLEQIADSFQNVSPDASACS